MMKYKFDPVKGTITITKEFADALQNPDSDESILLNKFRSNFPNLKIVQRTHASPKKYTNQQGEKFHCNQFKNLTYDNMENFIEALPNHDEYLAEFKFARYHASKLQTNGYVLVRKWFTAQFPEFRTNPMSYLHNLPNLISFADIKEKVANEKRLQENAENVG